MPWRLNEIAGLGTRPVEFEFDIDQSGVVPGKVPEETHWPVRLLQLTKHEVLSDYTIGPTSSHLLVSSRFRELVEEKDTVKHLFIPVEIYKYVGKGHRQRGALISSQHALFYPKEPVVDGLVIEESDLRETRLNKNITKLSATSQNPRLTWRSGAVGSRNLWNDARLPRAIVVSDEFYQEMKSEKFTGYQAQESRFSESHG